MCASVGIVMGYCCPWCTLYEVYLLLQYHGMTALMYASEGGKTECVEALLNRQWGADVNIGNNVSSTKAMRCLLR